MRGNLQVANQHGILSVTLLSKSVQTSFSVFVLVTSGSSEITENHWHGIWRTRVESYAFFERILITARSTKPQFVVRLPIYLNPQLRFQADMACICTGN